MSFSFLEIDFTDITETFPRRIGNFQIVKHHAAFGTIANMQCFSRKPTSLISLPYNILERLIPARVEPIVGLLLPRQQAGFQRGRSTVDQTVLLTQSIDYSFKAKKKFGAVFVDLTPAYDTVWHRGLTSKLLRLLPDKHMVRMIMELVRNRSFTLTTGDSKQSRLRRLQNALP